MAVSMKIKWLSQPEDHNYPNAASYLSLLYDKNRVKKMIKRLKTIKLVQYKAKDIFRASQLSLLGVSNSHIEKDRMKIRKGIKLSPLLLVRDKRIRRVIVADGYHRLCAIYGFNEDAWIPCKII